MALIWKIQFFGINTVTTNSGELSTSPSVLLTNPGVNNDTASPKMTVNLDLKSILPHSTVSLNLEDYSPSASNQLHNSRIPNNAIFSKKAVNSSKKCILPLFTVNWNFGETCRDWNSQSPVLRTLHNDDLVPITVEDSESDEFHDAQKF